MQYQVIFTGSLKANADAKKARSAIAKWCKLSENKAKVFLSKPRVIKNNLSEIDARRYAKKLSAVGLIIKIRPMPDVAKKSSTTTNSPVSKTAPKPASQKTINPNHRVDKSTQAKLKKGAVKRRDVHNSGHKHQKKLLSPTLVLFAVLGSLAFGAGAYWFFMSPTEKKQTTPITARLKTRINDTGVTHIGNSKKDCSGATNWPADCHYGRDAQALVGKLQKRGHGNAGFDFTKLDSSGNGLPHDATQWACVKDNVTQLVWEVKTTNKGLHDSNRTYTWLNPDSRINGNHAGEPHQTMCNDINCNTQSFIQAVNQKKHCGISNWRLPGKFELLGLVDMSQRGPSIDINFFPNTQYDSGKYWAIETYAKNTRKAWVVSFYAGFQLIEFKNSFKFVRLVSSDGK